MDAVLHDAVDNIDIEGVKQLLISKADVNAKDKDGNTALHLAAKKGLLEIATLLLNNKAYVNAKNTKGSTPLLIIASNFKPNPDDLKFVKLLIEKGANINAVDNSGIAATGWASRQGNSEILEVLKAVGAKAADGDVNNDRPLGTAIASLTLGIASITGFGALIVPPILAVVYGVKTLSKIKLNPDLKGSGMATAGIVMGATCLAAMFFAGIIFGSSVIISSVVMKSNTPEMERHISTVPKMEGAVATKKTMPTATHVVGDFNVTLSPSGDGQQHLLQTNIVLAYEADKETKLSSELSVNSEKIKVWVRNILIKKKYSDLVGEDSLDRLKEEILAGVNSDLTNGKISDIYFTSFVVQ